MMTSAGALRNAAVSTVFFSLVLGFSLSQPAWSRQPVLPPGQSIKDDLGFPFRLPGATPSRIVSMAPNITEILFALGLGDRVVGVTRFCDYPPAALAIPKIGGLIDPNIEVIESLRPDLVIAFRGNPLRMVERIRKLGLPVFVLDIGSGLDAIDPLIAKIGLVTRRGAEARALGSSLRARIAAVATAFEGVPSKPRVLVLLFSQGLWTAGGGSYVSDLVARAGAVNIAAGVPQKWILWSPEKIIRGDPDAVFILTQTGADFAAARDRLTREAHLGGLEAVKRGRVYRLDESSASRFGPRLADVLEVMAHDLHPDKFGGRP